MSDPLGLEQYGYPKTAFTEGRDGEMRVRFTEGWFLSDIDEDEPAYYMDYYIDKRGKVVLVIDAFWHLYAKLLSRGKRRVM